MLAVLGTNAIIWVFRGEPAPASLKLRTKVPKEPATDVVFRGEPAPASLKLLGRGNPDGGGVQYSGANLPRPH